ncbi:MAG: helix-turn-helix transcriptional regulator [Pseudomonadota bacterium]
MTTSLELAAILDNERKRQALTISEVIKRTGVSRAAIYRLFKGGDVQLTTLLAVTDLLGLDLLAMRTDVARLMPDTADGVSAATRKTLAQEKSRQREAAPGPLSAVAARAARLQGKLQLPH